MAAECLATTLSTNCVDFVDEEDAGSRGLSPFLYRSNINVSVILPAGSHFAGKINTNAMRGGKE